MTTHSRTPGEQAFEDYLARLGLKYQFEPPLGARRPDYLVHSAVGDVLCEIKDFEQNPEDRAEVEAAARGVDTHKVRALPARRIQTRIREGGRKFREFKGKYPCLVVLFDASALVPLIRLTVLSAMYGKAQIRVPLASETTQADEETTTVFEREGRHLTRASNTSVSAVAILDYVRPNQTLLNDALAAQKLGDGPDSHTNMIRFAADFSRRHPEVHVRVPRLQVFRNLFAALPWPVGALPGPHDVFWRPAEGDSDAMPRPAE